MNQNAHFFSGLHPPKQRSSEKEGAGSKCLTQTCVTSQAESMKEKRHIPKRSEWLCTVLEALLDKALASFWAPRTSPNPMYSIPPELSFCQETSLERENFQAAVQ